MALTNLKKAYHNRPCTLYHHLYYKYIHKHTQTHSTTTIENICFRSFESVFTQWRPKVSIRQRKISTNNILFSRFYVLITNNTLNVLENCETFFHCHTQPFGRYCRYRCSVIFYIHSICLRMYISIWFVCFFYIYIFHFLVFMFCCCSLLFHLCSCCCYFHCCLVLMLLLLLLLSLSFCRVFFLFFLLYKFCCCFFLLVLAEWLASHTNRRDAYKIY